MPIPQPLLKGTQHDYQIGHLVDVPSPGPAVPSERRLLNLNLPPWQRPEVWTHAQKRRFVEGIFLGLGCGQYVVNGSDWELDGQPKPMSAWLLDGQQRISALRDFLAGDLVIFDDVSFPALPAADQLRFKRRPFQCFELDYTNDETALMELYDRLNFSGTPHTAEQRVLPCLSIQKESCHD